MTLRHRLLLVYLLVVLMSVATVGVAFYELNRTQHIYGPLLTWHDIILDVHRLKAAFPPQDPPDEENGFEVILPRVQRKIALVGDYLDVEYIRSWHYRLGRAYQEWRAATPELREERAEDVIGTLNVFTSAVERVLEDLNSEAEQQKTLKWALLGLVCILTASQVLILGWLLRRWLLHPMQRLNRQVEALGRDQPPPEPLLTAPLEMANLAAALDKARQSLQAYRRQLIENERLTTIGQFAAQLAHNLRNPLASIRAAAQVTSRHERDNDYVRDRMSEVVSSVDRLNQWIGGLMEIARRDPTPTGRADVVPLLHRIAEALRPELSAKEIQLSVEAPEGGLNCVHDPATLEQALVAMVVNAIEASPLGASITLRTEVACPPSDGVANRVCRISVNDRGPGLPKDAPERIFEFSYSTKQRGMGLGLGLARLALERQGGEAHALNNDQGGATVYVDLPIGSENLGSATVIESRSRES